MKFSLLSCAHKHLPLFRLAKHYSIYGNFLFFTETLQSDHGKNHRNIQKQQRPPKDERSIRDQSIIYVPAYKPISSWMYTGWSWNVTRLSIVVGIQLDYIIMR